MAGPCRRPPALRQGGVCRAAGRVRSAADLFKERSLSEQAYTVTEQLDLGDWIGVTGIFFRTKTNEFTVEVHELTFLSKALRPLPEKWHGLTDVETRYRQRYVDLIANPEVHGIFAMRSRIIAGIRAFLIERGFLEVETPMMHPIPGGAAGEAVCHPPQCARGGSLSSHRAGTVFEAADRGRISPRVRNQSELPERRHLDDSQSGIHDAGVLCLLCRLPGPDHSDRRTDLCRWRSRSSARRSSTIRAKTIKLTPPWRRWSYHQAILEVNKPRSFGP